MNQSKVKPAEGKLGILIVGNGAVATTFMTGVLMARKGLGKPVGSMTQYDKIRVGRGESKQYLKYGEIVPLSIPRTLTRVPCMARCFVTVTSSRCAMSWSRSFR